MKLVETKKGTAASTKKKIGRMRPYVTKLSQQRLGSVHVKLKKMNPRMKNAYI
jgi:hypothetical protein